MESNLYAALSVPLTLAVVCLLVYYAMYSISYFTWRYFTKKFSTQELSFNNYEGSSDVFSSLKVSIQDSQTGVGSRAWVDLNIYANGICLIKESIFGKINKKLPIKVFIPFGDMELTNNSIILHSKGLCLVIVGCTEAVDSLALRIGKFKSGCCP
jgi:hypothetical protein